MHVRRSSLVRVLPLLVLALLQLAAPAPASAAPVPVPVPADGTAYFGVHLDWSRDSPSAYAARTGFAPAQYGDFAHLPLTSGEKTALSARVDVLAAAGARLFLTVEPGSLSGVTPAAVTDLASTLAGYNARGVQVLLRFAHEMNGSWYPWGQQPGAYVEAFRRVADAVHATAPGTAVIWAPNYGGGYPYTGGTFAAQPGTADFRLLDTDGSGTLTMADDPYAPYYPGDAYVDWVGLTLYHFGHQWPYGENEVPEAGKLGQQLRGTYTGNGRYEDQSAVPDFYEAFAVAKGKPLALSETGALYNESPSAPGSTELDIKAAWIQQVYGARAALPLVKLINWFEIRKYEGETASYVDWRATAAPAVLSALQTQVAGGGYVFAGSSSSGSSTVPGAPTALSASATPSKITLSWRPPASDGGAPVTSYRACLGQECRTVTGTTAAFSGLQRATRYQAAVQAANRVGLGPAAGAQVSTR